MLLNLALFPIGSHQRRKGITSHSRVDVFGMHRKRALNSNVSNHAYKNQQPYKYPSFIHAHTGSIRRYFLRSIFLRWLLLAHPSLLDFCIAICCWLCRAQEPSAKHFKLQASISNNLLGPLLGFTVSRCYVLSISP